MQVPISEAKGKLTELVRRAEAGDEVVLTRRGHPIARIAPISAQLRGIDERRAFLKRLRESGKRKVTEGPDAARSQDYLYDEFGLPK